MNRTPHHPKSSPAPVSEKFLRGGSWGIHPDILAGSGSGLPRIQRREATGSPASAPRLEAGSAGLGGQDAPK